MIPASEDAVRAVTLNVLAALQIAQHYIPESGTICDRVNYDYVIVGGGTAGSIMASRLSENPNVSVALIETGAQQPYESVHPGYYPLMPGTNYDYNFYTEDNQYGAQAIRGKAPWITAGKMLGGTSGLHRMVHTRSNRRDFESWVKLSKDKSWSYDEMMKYYIKSEKLQDRKILDSADAALHGKNGSIGLTRQPFAINVDIINSFKELGSTPQLDLNGFNTLGIAEPLFQISKGVRQSMAQAYLQPASGRPNLSIFTHTTATKIIFNDQNCAVAVEVVDCRNKTQTLTVNKEVIIAAGVVKSAQLLFLSGIGPREYIESWGINVVSDLPVGLALRDQVGAPLAFKLKPSNKATTDFNRYKFPIAMTVALRGFDCSAKYPDYKTINMYFPQNSTMLAPVCTNELKYIDEICNRFLAANQEGDLFITTVYNLYTESTGKMYLRDTNPFSDPWIYMGMFWEPKDLVNLAAYVQEISKIANTRYFKKAGAEFVELDLEFCNWRDRWSYDYWKCYARSMSTLLQHVTGSAPIGPVLNAQLEVHGVKKLRVVGAAAIPALSSGAVITDEIVLAEKAADMVKAAQ